MAKSFEEIRDYLNQCGYMLNEDDYRSAQSHVDITKLHEITQINVLK